MNAKQTTRKDALVRVPERDATVWRPRPPLLSDAEYGAFKRAWECYGADPRWRESFSANPAERLMEFPEIKNTYAAFKAIGMLTKMYQRDGEIVCKPGRSQYYDEYMRRYKKVKASLEERFREERFADGRLFRWNAIALKRAKLQVIEMRKTPTLRYYPLMFELSDGCRQQCPFCGLAAGAHRGDFLATPENLRLWREILAASREILGDIAADAACYFATEPLDNPDYETLLAEFAAVMDHYPQTTTALAAKEPERIRALMKRMGKERMSLAALRFSVRSLPDFRRIMELYSPEELADVEVLGSHLESGGIYSSSGRLYKKDPPTGKQVRCYSISCIAGFRVNMARKSVAFMEPALPSDEYPTGVHLRAEKIFATARDYRHILREFVENFAVDALPDHLPLMLSPKVTAEEGERYFLFQGNGVRLRMGGDLYFRQAVRQLKEKPRALEEIFRSLGIGEFVGAGLRQKLQILYEKGYLALV